jgi:hypothetical protein
MNLSKKTEDLITKLEIKSNNWHKKMPSITSIRAALLEMGIRHEFYTTTNTVEYRNKGAVYVNNRREGKEGKRLKIYLTDEESKVLNVPYIALNTADSYYSNNSYIYARQLTLFFKLKNKVTS